MTDRHLNLFYSYNRDNELIENNLTRALIVSLQIINGGTRDRFLQLLLNEEISRITLDQQKPRLDYSEAKFALQGYMDVVKSRNFPIKYILPISSHRYDELSVEDEIGEIEGDGLSITRTYAGSIPDGWIYDEKAGYCFLIEAKVGSNPLNQSQIYSHAQDWFNLTSIEEIEAHIVPLTWVDVLTSIDKLENETDSGLISPNEQELLLLASLNEYIGYFGYTIFHGLSFEDLYQTPSIDLTLGTLTKAKEIIFDFRTLQHPPSFQISS